MFKKILQVLLSFALITYSTATVISCTEIENQNGNGIPSILNKIDQKIKEYNDTQVGYSDEFKYVKNKVEEIQKEIEDDVKTLAEDNNLIVDNNNPSQNTIKFDIETEIEGISVFNSSSFTKPNSYQVTFSYLITKATKKEDSEFWEYLETDKLKDTKITIKETAQSYIKIEPDQNGGENKKDLLFNPSTPLEINYEVINPVDGDNSLEVIDSPDYLNITIKSEGKYGNIENYKGIIKVSVKNDAKFPENSQQKLKFKVKSNSFALKKELDLNVIKKTEINIYNGFYDNNETLGTPIDLNKKIEFEENEKEQKNFTVEIINPYTKGNEINQRITLDVINERQIIIDPENHFKWIEYNEAKNASYYNLGIQPGKRGNSIIGFDYKSGKNSQISYRLNSLKTIVMPSPEIQDIKNIEISFSQKTFNQEFIVLYSFADEVEEQPEVEIKDTSILKVHKEFDPIHERYEQNYWKSKYEYTFEILSGGQTEIIFHYEGAEPKKFNVNITGQPIIHVEEELQLIEGDIRNIDISVENHIDKQNLQIKALESAKEYVGYNLKWNNTNGAGKIEFTGIKATKENKPAKFEVIYPNAIKSKIIEIDVLNKPIITLSTNKIDDLRVKEDRIVDVKIKNELKNHELNYKIISGQENIKINQNNNQFKVIGVKEGKAKVKFDYYLAEPVFLDINVVLTKLVLQTEQDITIIGKQKQEQIIFEVNNPIIGEQIEFRQTNNNIIDIKDNNNNTFTITSKNSGTTDIIFSYKYATSITISVTVKDKPEIVKPKDLTIRTYDKNYEYKITVNNFIPDQSLSVSPTDIANIEIKGNTTLIINPKKVGKDIITLNYPNAESVNFNLEIIDNPVITIDLDNDIKIFEKDTKIINYNISNEIIGESLEFEIKNNDNNYITVIHDKSNKNLKITANKITDLNIQLILKYSNADNIIINIEVINKPEFFGDIFQKGVQWAISYTDPKTFNFGIRNPIKGEKPKINILDKDYKLQVNDLKYQGSNNKGENWNWTVQLSPSSSSITSRVEFQYLGANSKIVVLTYIFN